MTTPATTTGLAPTPALGAGTVDSGSPVPTEPERNPCLLRIEALLRLREGERIRRRALESAWSWARLISFAAAVTAWYPLRANDLLGAGASTLCFAGFLFTVGRHREMRRRRENMDRELTLLTESRACVVDGRWAPRSADRPAPSGATGDLPSLLDDGLRGELTTQELDDLDVYGRPTGLFGMLNRCSTAMGARRLANIIEQPMLSANTLERRQATLEALGVADEERVRAMAGIAALRGHDEPLEQFITAINQVAALSGAAGVAVLRVWSIVTLGLTLLLLYRLGMGDYAAGAWMLSLLVVNGVLFRTRSAELNAALKPWRRTQVAAEGLLIAAQEAGAAVPSVGELVRISKALTDGAAPAVLPKLCRTLAWVDAGGPMHAVFNHWLFYDLHVAASVLKVVVGRRQTLIDAIRAVADLDALSGLAAFGWERKDTCRPRFTANPVLRIQAGRHPIVSPTQCVANDVTLDARLRVLLVTGSNMSGKSTYLRMIGLNVLLAQVGAKVCADAMELCPLRLITDLRVRDNLARNESYFLAEVRHLKRLVMPAAQAAPVLGLIDEPFRGTNSDEQAAATLAVIEYLQKMPHFFVIATHERRVTRLGDGVTARNVHFQENLSRCGMVFDYRLRPGPAATRNALRLLEAEAYPREVTDRAAWWAGAIGAAEAREGGPAADGGGHHVA